MPTVILAVDPCCCQELQGLKAKHRAALIKFKEVEKEHQKETSLKEARGIHAQKAKAAQASVLALEKKHSAAVTVIQAHWKGYKVRQMTKGGKDKGKKGKKKK
jgi:hypothetical protein